MGWFSSSPPSSASPNAPEPVAQDSMYKPLKRNERKACWDARDKYFACLDRNNILDAIKDEEAASKSCSTASSAFEADCASSWVA